MLNSRFYSKLAIKVSSSLLVQLSKVYVWVHVQVLCGKCGNGLGHEFLSDGPEEGMSRF